MRVDEVDDLIRGAAVRCPGDQKHSPVVQIRVSEHTRDKLRTIAKARGMSISKLSRKVLDEFVERESLG